VIKIIKKYRVVYYQRFGKSHITYFDTLDKARKFANKVKQNHDVYGATFAYIERHAGKRVWTITG
jgi:hypothetical protein